MQAELENETIGRLEAALYSAGRPLSIEELIKASGSQSRAKTLTSLSTIMKKTKSAHEALEIVILPDGSYVFQLKPEFIDVTRKFASKPLLPKATLKTLSYIASMQPISSKDLLAVRGSGVYSHLQELRQLDFIVHQSVGRLKIYSTSPKFQKYFGIEGDVNSLKEKLFKKIRKKNLNQKKNPENS